MACHIAIIKPCYEPLILDGRKTVECRLTRNHLPPFGCIRPGERIFFKRSAGPFFAAARCDQVWMTDNLTPAGVKNLRRTYDRLIRGDAAYYAQRADARYGTLIWLREVRPCRRHPQYQPQHMRAWYVLPDESDPFRNGQPDNTSDCFLVKLTSASLTHSVVAVAPVADRFPPDSFGGRTKDHAGRPMVLHMEDGPTIETDIDRTKKIFRWRGWGRWFRVCGVTPRDALRFTPCGPHAFHVDIVKPDAKR